CQQHNTHPRTF
nr:immunoglobulin light chain junction region [Macaca mulatta]